MIIDWLKCFFVAIWLSVALGIYRFFPIAPVVTLKMGIAVLAFLFLLIWLGLALGSSRLFINGNDRLMFLIFSFLIIPVFSTVFIHNTFNEIIFKNLGIMTTCFFGFFIFVLEPSPEQVRLGVRVALFFWAVVFAYVFFFFDPTITIHQNDLLSNGQNFRLPLEFFGIFFLFLFNDWFQKKGPRKAFFYSVLVCAVIILPFDKRQYLLSLILLFLFGALIVFKKNRIGWILLFIISSLLMIIVYHSIDDLHIYLGSYGSLLLFVANDQTLSEGSLLVRYVELEAALDLIARFPLFGTGFLSLEDSVFSRYSYFFPSDVGFVGIISKFGVLSYTIAFYSLIMLVRLGLHSGNADTNGYSFFLAWMIVGSFFGGRIGITPFGLISGACLIVYSMQAFEGRPRSK